MKKLFIISALAVCLILTSCSGREKKEYGNEPAAGKGSVKVNPDGGFDINLMNIFTGTGASVDYLKNVKVDDGCDVNVDSSAVDSSVPGDYIVIYTVTDGKNTESEEITVTIRDSGESVTEAEAETIKSGEVIGGENVKYPEQGAQTAKIELLSGKTAEIKCTTKRYIVSTRTDSSDIVKGKKRYNQKKLVVVFNTGEEQVLETIQKKID